MDAEQARAYLLAMPDVVETQQWGNNLVYWVGDKAIGGKMFALLNLDDDRGTGLTQTVIGFAVEPERFAELVEREGLCPAPYLARAHWVSATRWQAFSEKEWRQILVAAEARVRAKLPAKVKRFLELPKSEQRRQLSAARKLAKAKEHLR